MGFDIRFSKRRTVGRSLEEATSVALFTDTFVEVNGAAHTLRKVAEAFAAKGLNLDIYCYGEETGIEERGTVRIIRFDHRISSNYYEKLRFELVPDFSIGERFREALVDREYTVVHLATPGSMGLAGRTLAKRYGLPLVGTYHTHLADYVSLRSSRSVAHLMKQACWRFMRWFYMPCEWVLAPTEGVIRELQQNGFENRLGVFSRGIDINLYSVKKRKRRDSRIVTSYVGRCAPEKNVQYIGSIVEGVDTDLWVIGDGPERTNLEKQLRMARFTGYLHGEELATAYADSDILLFPSTTDTFGNVVLEAMASGVVPIVAAGRGPSDYVEHEVNAMVGDGPEGMRRSLRLLTENHELRNRMRINALQFAEKRDWVQAIEPLLNAYRSVAIR